MGSPCRGARGSPVIVRRAHSASPGAPAEVRTPASGARTSQTPAERRWIVAAPRPLLCRSLAAELSIGEIAVQCLVNRGIVSGAPGDRDDAHTYLSAGLGDLLPPDRLPDIDAAVARLRQALRDNETICVWGDYDVDGIGGASVLIRFLRQMGAERVVPLIPERTGSGYGFHWPTMERLARDEGVTLFVSVDHGCTAVDEVTRAQEAGLDVVIADHHEMAPQLPPAVAVVNPKRPDSEYEFPYLCGTGVAMKVAWALAQDMSPGARVTDEMREFLLTALGTAVLGTVADVVPLRGENRIIVRHGLRVLAERPTAGLRALLDISRATAPLDASDVGFRLGPRLNAAGRMGNARAALELLLTDDPVEARKLAEWLDDANTRRRAIERGVAEEAMERALAEFGPDPDGGIVLLGDEWHHGVIGIVAARLVDAFHVPVVMISAAGGVARGSARSVPGFVLHEALRACGEHLVAHGGHAAAAGLTIDPARFDGFRDAFTAYVRENLPIDARRPRLEVDAEVPLSALRPGLVAELARLAPFGAGNAEPVLAVRGVRVAGRARRMGQRGEHVAFHVRDEQSSLRLVAFRQAARFEPLLSDGGPIDVAFVPQRNQFRGRDEVEGVVRDIRRSDPAGG